ncbi:F-box/LRR-repeat MAX2 homolog A [Linum grandiflorum]
MTATAGESPAKTINDLPDVILYEICAAVSDTRARNSLSLVNRKFHALERSTRHSLTLRGNARDLFLVPSCFRSVTHLDLSLLSPWGHSLLLSSASSDPHLLASLLAGNFPAVTSLTVYSRSPQTLAVLLRHWPRLSHVKLVRWHQRPSSGDEIDFDPLFQQCRELKSLDLSNFYYWTEDLPPVLQRHPFVAKSLTRLNLLTVSLSDGFKAEEIVAITAACSNLTEFLVACMFDHSYIGFVGDESLQSIASNCPKLSILHLVDTASLLTTRATPEEDGYTAEDAGVTLPGLIDFFSKLPLLEELVLDVCKNIRNSSTALEALNSKCPKLKVLRLGYFHGVCLAFESRLDGLALCSTLEALSIKNSADLTDMVLIEIARGCCKLSKFEIEGCSNVTMQGMRTFACLLRRTLIEVKISACKNLNAVSSLRALEPVQDRIERLHIDCVWDGLQELGEEEEEYDCMGFDLNEDYYASKKKKCRYSDELLCSSSGNGFYSRTWKKLKCLSLWIAIGELLTPLTSAGLEDCPNLEEIRIKIEGDCRARPKPAQRAFGLNILTQYPELWKMKLDCSDTIGYALTAPSGLMDLSLWERYFLNDIGSLSIVELDYWPPQDRDVNQRSLSLPAVGLLAESLSLRKLFIHGTAHEHFMRFLLKIPSLRDVQLREDYYPAPENDMSTEMRVDSCSRFEDALNGREIPD